MPRLAGEQDAGAPCAGHSTPHFRFLPFFKTVFPKEGAWVSKLIRISENERPWREASLQQIGCERVCSIDFCAASGGDLGGKWSVLVVNEQGRLLGQAVVSTTAFNEELGAFLRGIACRSNFKANVVVIDNCPPQHADAHGRPDSKMLDFLVDVFKLRNTSHIVQDKFHVAHSVSPHFNNQHPHYHERVIRGWREATNRRDPEDERSVDDKLLAGAITKKITFRGHVIDLREGSPLSLEQIQELKRSGAYHDLFSQGSEVLVREHVKDKAALLEGVKEWCGGLMRDYFDASGVAVKTGPRGQRLIASQEALLRTAANGEKRILNCVPPAGSCVACHSHGQPCDACCPTRLPAWKSVGCSRANKLPMWKALFHTCGVESWNALEQNFVQGSNCNPRYALARYYEGISRHNTNIARRLGLEHDAVHHQPWLCWRVNEWAGFGNVEASVQIDGAQTAPQLLKYAPHPQLARPEQHLHQIAAISAPGSRHELSMTTALCADLPAPRLLMAHGHHARRQQTIECAFPSLPVPDPSDCDMEVEESGSDLGEYARPPGPEPSTASNGAENMGVSMYEQAPLPEAGSTCSPTEVVCLQSHLTKHGPTPSTKKVKQGRSTGGRIARCKWACVCASPRAMVRGQNNKHCIQKRCPRFLWKHDKQWTRTNGREADMPNIPHDGAVEELLHINNQGTHIVYDTTSVSWYFCKNANTGEHNFDLYADMHTRRGC
jgi:hypothetical protein